MKNLMMAATSGLVFLCLFSACQKDREVLLEPVAPVVPEEKSYPGVDERLWIYFERFEEEALEQGLDVDLIRAGITGVIEAIDEQHVAGRCNYSRHRPNHVTIDTEFWNRSSERFREFIIFHELGHCSLYRDHREDAYSNGACISIMRSGTGDCIDNYNSRTRNTYLKELFDLEQINTL